VAVIGAGQSAAETLLETYNRLKALIASDHRLETSAEIDLLIKQGHLRPSDDSPFANEVFNPQATDFFYDLSAQELRPRMNSQSPIQAHERVNDILLKEAAATNYAVVSPETLSTVSNFLYPRNRMSYYLTDELKKLTIPLLYNTS
jgi:L-ornithine N5-oxygenase